ncbi:hypothetical protein ACFP51_14700 [Streptomyces pratens]|uniref:Uncharacterized protein n=1 Tax=Streptomyces pratens TaxID=887456 RepID=A0ABW1M5A8_9ACTN
MSARTRTTLGAMAVLTSLTVAAPIAISTAAHADVSNPRVSVSGTVSCLRQGDNSSPTRVSIATQSPQATSRSTSISTEDTDALYGLTFNNIPKSGTSASATVTCQDVDGNESSFTVPLRVIRPALANAMVLTRNLA